MQLAPLLRGVGGMLLIWLSKKYYYELSVTESKNLA